MNIKKVKIAPNSDAIIKEIFLDVDEQIVDNLSSETVFIIAETPFKASCVEINIKIGDKTE